MKSKCLIVSFLVILLSLAACMQNRDESSDIFTWQVQYDLGIRYLADGNYEEAIIAFTAAIEIDPRQAEAYIGLADVYAAQGNTEQAYQVLSDALNMVENEHAIREKLAAIESAEEFEMRQIPLDGYPKTERYDFEDGGYSIREYNEFGNIVKRIQYGADGRESNRSDYEYNEFQKLLLERWSAIGNYGYGSEQEFNSHGVDYYGEDGRVIKREDYSDGVGAGESHITYNYLEGSSMVIIDINSTTYKEDLHIIYTMESSENEVIYGGGSSDMYIIVERTPGYERNLETRYNLDGTVISKEYW